MPRGEHFKKVLPVVKDQQTFSEKTRNNPQTPVPEVEPFEAPDRTWEEIESVQTEEDALALVRLCSVPDTESVVFVSEDKKVMFYTHLGWLREYCTKNHLKLFEVIV